jgi:hypothetical protein
LNARKKYQKMRWAWRRGQSPHHLKLWLSSPLGLRITIVPVFDSSYCKHLYFNGKMFSVRNIPYRGQMPNEKKQTKNLPQGCARSRLCWLPHTQSWPVFNLAFCPSGL